MKRILFEASPADGNGPAVPDQAPPVTAMSPAAPPPAGTVVLEGDVTEELVNTRKKLEDSERKKKEVETRASELEDENRRLKQAGVQPAPDVDKRSTLEKWFAGEEV